MTDCCEEGWVTTLEPYPDIVRYDRERGRDVTIEQGRIVAEGRGLVPREGQSIEGCPNLAHRPDPKNEGPCVVIVEGLVQFVSHPCPVHKPDWIHPSQRGKPEPEPEKGSAFAGNRSVLPKGDRD